MVIIKSSGIRALGCKVRQACVVIAVECSLDQSSN